MSAQQLGREALRLDGELASFLDDSARQHLWDISHQTLLDVEGLPQDEPRTGLVLGYVQSGKTTAMTALMAAAVDSGYQIIIALLGATNILLSQNAGRIRKYLGIDTRNDYSWVGMRNPKGGSATKEIAEWLTKKRALFIPALKHKGRIADLAAALRQVGPLSDIKVLVVDDEADQGSLNTEVRKGTESRVYAAIDDLRNALPKHAFIQFTATPYAPLLLQPEDPLFPRAVQFLQPGKGYTGGREFFVDHQASVVRYIPAGDEQATARLPIELPGSLHTAIWSFIIGSAVMLENIADSAPISMLIHSSHRNDVQERYHFLLSREIRALQLLVHAAQGFDQLPTSAHQEYERLLRLGVSAIEHNALLGRIRYVLSEIKLWLLNSVTAIKKIDWNVSPIHMLVGGNKLDRGFTVEGLTVTYMNRPASDQLDTVEQRARAFGYRSEFLPFCQFFGSARTVKMLREIVFTEYDLRAKLQDYIAEGRSVADWAQEIGLLIPGGAKPTRDAVVRELSRNQFGWHQLRRPTVTAEAIDRNWALCSDLGLLNAPIQAYGRLSFRTLRLSTQTALDALLANWYLESYSPDWRREELEKAFERASQMQKEIDVVLMEQEAGTSAASPRTRKWTDQEGFINLFQGRDVTAKAGKLYYAGDREIAVPTERMLIQVHRVVRRGHDDDSRLLTLALHLGDRQIVARSRA